MKPPLLPLHYDDEDNEDDDEENAEEVKMPPLRVREESKVLAPLEEQEEYLRSRSTKISKIHSSLHKIHKMYETLNDIV